MRNGSTLAQNAQKMVKLLIAILVLPAISFAQQRAVVSMDLVRVKNGHYTEAVYFFENNWKIFRDSALAKGYISSYQLLKNKRDTVGGVDIILITEYSSEEAYNQRESRFQPLIKSIRPAGLLLINDLKREDFILSTTNVVSEVLHSR